MIRTQAQADRHVAILEALRAGGMTTVDGIRRRLLVNRNMVVTVATIRRDLLKMEATGSVVRRRGALPGHRAGNSMRRRKYDGWEVVK